MLLLLAVFSTPSFAQGHRSSMYLGVHRAVLVEHMSVIAFVVLARILVVVILVGLILVW